MLTVLLVIHLMIAVALVGVVLLQRSEGGALGIGGGGGGGGFMTGRGTANALTRLTALLALGFFITSIALTVLARIDHGNRLTIDSLGKAAATAPATTPTPAAPAPATTPAATAAPATPAVPATDPAKKP
jgi:preprotein translocase subunit SecG